MFLAIFYLPHVRYLGQMAGPLAHLFMTFNPQVETIATDACRIHANLPLLDWDCHIFLCFHPLPLPFFVLLHLRVCLRISTWACGWLTGPLLLC